MTTVLDISTDGPGTHVFIIGAGSYQHLQGGSAAKKVEPDMGLDQLSSPVFSALAVAEWFHKVLSKPNTFGSIELLISANRATSFHGQKIDPATLSKVQDGFDRWYARCDGHRDNIAIFYFCGHGVQKTDLLLLLADLGAPGGRVTRLFQKSINFHQTYRGMNQCSAKTQCYFLDCCRQLPKALHDRIDSSANTLIESVARSAHMGRSAPVVMATSQGSEAFGIPNGVSRFTSALLSALSGLGSEKIDGNWYVTTGRIGAAISTILAQEPDQAYPQRSSTEGEVIDPTSTIIALDGVPSVPVRITSEPDKAMGRADLKVKTHSGSVKASRKPTPGHWNLELPASFYTVHASFKGSTTLSQEELWALPPWARCTVKET